MTGYYKENDLEKFASMGEEAPELWNKFMDYYGAVFDEGGADSTGEIADSAGGGSCRAVPLLY